MSKKIFWSLIFAFLLMACNDRVSAEEEEDAGTDSIIVEKNLFHPERKKWIMEPKKDKKGDKKGAEKVKKGLSDIQLYGTVIQGDQRYAILRASKGKKKIGEDKLYMPGDYISGFLIAEIEPKKVVLRDDGKNEDYEIFINEGKKERSAVKTEIKIEKDDRIDRDSGKKKSSKKKRKAPKPKKAQTADFLKKRLEKDIKTLRKKNTKLVRKQAEKDYKKLERLMGDMDDKTFREVQSMKRELDELLKKK